MNAPSPNEIISAEECYGIIESSSILRSQVTCSFQTVTLITHDSPSKYHVPDYDINPMTYNTLLPVTSHRSGSLADTSASLQCHNNIAHHGDN